MGQLKTTQSTAVAKVSAAQEAVQQYLTFLLSGEMYAVGILNVKEIIEYGQLTEIPMMPAFIRGVINLRGSVVPVIDLAARFGGQQTAVSRRTCIVIIELTGSGNSAEDRHDVGVVVDAVSEVLEVSSADIEPPPAFGANIRADFIDGMGKIAGKFVIILNIQRVLSIDEIAQLATLKEHGTEAAAEAA
ncbi:chemotaxis protein CheW [Denitratisoma sp. DHT3]|uniref:chemotaxis protein CheW n=1 Tax=Denitratisoma sp. DHT3 TaxID=1981880 RepID=UPI001198B5F6|nr:chemotaxis protein CheW [Denitratisoma sp. DHT3]QDX80579.1 chemotaxis protein CheW [Denitratisoma sp. DHT3]